MAKVSIIIPIYKIPTYALKLCVENIQNQTYKDIEILLIDDGSPDNCGTICDEYATHDERVKCYHKQNGGVSTARNLGLCHSTGDYILFVDADDALHPHAIELMLDIAMKDKSDIVVCNYLRFYTQGVPFKKSTIDHNYKTFVKNDELIAMRKKCLIEDDTYGVSFNGAPWGKLYTRDVIGDLRFNNELIRSQDNHFNFRVFARVKKISYTPSQLYFYRHLEQSSVNRFRPNLFEISDKYIRAVEEEIQSDLEEYKSLFLRVRLEKLGEFYSSFIAHTENKANFSEKISLMQKVKKEWLREDCIPKLHRFNLYAIVYYKLLRNNKFRLLWVLIWFKLNVRKMYYSLLNN